MNNLNSSLNLKLACIGTYEMRIQCWDSQYYFSAYMKFHRRSVLKYLAKKGLLASLLKWIKGLHEIKLSN